MVDITDNIHNKLFLNNDFLLDIQSIYKAFTHRTYIILDFDI